MSFLKFLDYLSPSITLFYYGKRAHISNVGGILTVIMILGCIGFAVYYFWSLFSHSGANVLYYRQFEYEAGIYPFNSSSLFTVMQMYSANSGGYIGEYNQKNIRIFLTRESQSYTEQDQKIFTSEHWVYDVCTEEDKKGMDASLFTTIANFSISACLRYYYEPKDDKYYKVGDPKYVSPTIGHGISRTDNLILGTILERCRNDTKLSNLLGPCNPKNEIDAYIVKYFAVFYQIIDHQVYPTHYKDPIQKYFYVLSGSIQGSEYPVHNVQLSPIKISSNVGFFLDDIKEEYAYQFQEDRRGSKSNPGSTQIVSQFDFWLSNNVLTYSREYKNLFDTIPSIGGVIQVLFYLFQSLNLLYNKLILLQNTRSLFLKIHGGLEEVSNSSNSSPRFNSIFRNNYSLTKSISRIFDKTTNELHEQNSLMISSIFNKHKRTFLSKNESPDQSRVQLNISKNAPMRESSLCPHFNQLNKIKTNTDNELILINNFDNNKDKNDKNDKNNSKNLKNLEQNNLISDQNEDYKNKSSISKFIPTNDEEKKASAKFQTFAKIPYEIDLNNHKESVENFESKKEMIKNNQLGNEDNSFGNKENKTDFQKFNSTLEINTNTENITTTIPIIIKKKHNVERKKLLTHKSMAYNRDIKYPKYAFSTLSPHNKERRNSLPINLYKRKYSIKDKEIDANKLLISKMNSSDNNNIKNNISNYLNNRYINYKRNLKEAKVLFLNKKFTLCDYIFSFCYGKNKKKNGVYIVEQFRKKLLSEEHLYRNHINLYYLQRYFESGELEKYDIKEIYKNL